MRHIKTFYLISIFLFSFMGSYAASSLETGKWVKIRVSTEGVYQLSSAKLRDMGFSDPSRVKLYGYSYEILPEAYIENLGNDLPEIPLWRRSDGTVLFYAHGVTRWTLQPSTKRYTHINNPYSLYHYYLLTEGDNPAKFPSADKVESSTSVTTFPDHSLIETDEFSFLSTGRTFFEAYDFASKAEKKYTLSLPGINGKSAWINVVFGAAGKQNSSLSVKTNGEQLGSLSFNALREYEYAVVQTLSKQCSNAAESTDIVLNHTRSSGIAGHLDYICATYTRNLRLSDKYLVFRPQQNGAFSYQVASANSATRVWRVTTSETTEEIPGTLSGTTYSASASSSNWTKEEYVAVNTDATFPEPEVVGAIKNQNLRSLKDIDLVILIPANDKLRNAAQKLADCHTARDGMRCVVVRADEVYNEFSAGTPDATAYRRLMKHLYDTASSSSSRPKNICLFGDGVWDNRMVTSTMKKLSPDDYLLCWESPNSWSHTDSYVMEEYFTILANGKGVSPTKDRPDCGVGRIAVKSASEADAVVKKLCTYINNEYAGDWQNTVCMIADDGNYNIHMQDAEAVVNTYTKQFPDFRIKKIYLDAYSREQGGTGSSYPDVTKEINHLMESGALIMNYTGHGAAYCLSHEQILKTVNFETWSSLRLPFWITAACDVSPFDMNITNIGEAALLNPKGGAVGMLSTTRTVYSSQNRAINNLFMKYVCASDEKGRRLTLGEALQYAKREISVSAMRDSINKCHFVLLGDPAITLAAPSPYKVKIESFSAGRGNVISAGDVVKVKGYITDASGNKMKDFNGTVSPTVLDSEVKVTCKNNAGEDVTPYTFKDRTKMLFNGTDSVRNGEFSFSFQVPLEINYSDGTGLMNIYACSVDRRSSAQGRYDSFTVGGTNPDIPTDTIGPELQIVMHRPNAALVPKTPIFRASIKDASGINTIGSGLGHDIVLIIDNDEYKTYNLNNYFIYDIGSSTSGTVEYEVPAMSPGSHTLLFRAWDLLNNSSTITQTFEVVDDYFHCIVYDINGKEVWNGNGDGYLYTLPKGIYIKKTVIETKKFLIK